MSEDKVDYQDPSEWLEENIGHEDNDPDYDFLYRSEIIEYGEMMYDKALRDIVEEVSQYPSVNIVKTLAGELRGDLKKYE